MMERIPDLPANVIGLSATGTVKGDDLENVVIPAMEATFTAHEKGRLSATSARTSRASAAPEFGIALVDRD